MRGKVEQLTYDLFDAIPAGVGSQRGDLQLSERDFEGLLTDGVEWAVERGLATSEDLERIEENGRIAADPSQVSSRARSRGCAPLKPRARRSIRTNTSVERRWNRFDYHPLRGKRLHGRNDLGTR